MEGDERDGDNFQFSEASEDGTYGNHARLGSATPGFETPGSNMFGAVPLQHEALVREGDGGSLDLPRDFYATLAEAPQASLIHLVSLYHQTLLKHGLVEDAEHITSMLAGLQNQEEVNEREELTGMDLLLKEGLLKYLMSIHPYIPPVPRQVVPRSPSASWFHQQSRMLLHLQLMSKFVVFTPYPFSLQVVKFKDLTYSMNVKVEKGYETMFTKVTSSRVTVYYEE